MRMSLRLFFAVQSATVYKLQTLSHAKPAYNTGMTKALQKVHVAPLTKRQKHRGMWAPGLQAAMAEVLQILLDAQPSCNVGIAEAMQMVNKSGVTLLGQAVAWGYAKALPPLLDAVS